MNIEIITEKQYGENCYVVYSEGSSICAVIDPASENVAEELKKLSLVPEFILLTHGHFDHISGVNALISEYPVPVYVHEDDAELLTDGNKNASSLLIGESITVNADVQTLEDDDIISLGNLEIDVMHTPGHTRGCVCYFCDNAVFTGDTIFAYDLGRTDLYGGDEGRIMNSVRKLMPMLRGKTIYPGHGPARKY